MAGGRLLGARERGEGQSLEDNRGAGESKAKRYDRQAAKQEKRARKMSSKIGRGNIRAARAATTAEGLRAAAERERAKLEKDEQPPQSTPPDATRGFES